MSYIQTSSQPVAKLFWILIIGTSFFMAAYNIYMSFLAWAESPFVTTVDILPISRLPIPDFTLCPPSAVARYNRLLRRRPAAAAPAGGGVGREQFVGEFLKRIVHGKAQAIVDAEMSATDPKYGSLDPAEFDVKVTDRCQYSGGARSAIFAPPAYFDPAERGKSFGICAFGFSVDSEKEMRCDINFDTIDLGPGAFSDKLSVFLNGKRIKKFDGVRAKEQLVSFAVPPGKNVVKVKSMATSSKKVKLFLASIRIYDPSGGGGGGGGGGGRLGTVGSLMDLMERYTEESIKDAVLEIKVSSPDASESVKAAVEHLASHAEALLRKAAGAPGEKVGGPRAKKLLQYLKYALGYRLEPYEKEAAAALRRLSGERLVETLILGTMYHPGFNEYRTVLGGVGRYDADFYGPDLIALLATVNIRPDEVVRYDESCNKTRICDKEVFYSRVEEPFQE